MKWNENCNSVDEVSRDIPIGCLCCFKPLNENHIHFAHMAGVVVDDFSDMSFMYILKGDGKYFFSREVIIRPDDVYTAADAEKYFLAAVDSNEERSMAIS